MPTFSPRIVTQSPVSVDHPEVAKGFYDDAPAFPRYYLINSSKDFVLALNILVPQSTNPLGRLSAQVFQPSFSGNVYVATLSAQSAVWQIRQDYYQGPILKQNLPAGFYEIEITGNQKAGKYVLVVGDKKESGFWEIVKTAAVLPIVKNNFFSDPRLGIIYLLFIFALVAFVLKYLWRRNSSVVERLFRKQ